MVTVALKRGSQRHSASSSFSEHTSAHSTNTPTKGRALKDVIVSALDAKKAQDIVIIDLAGKTDIADYMVIATGTSTTHLSALAKQVQEALESQNEVVCGMEGLEPPAEWVLIDNPEVMVHLFLEDARIYYNLERMWEADFNETDTLESGSRESANKTH